MTGCGFTPDGKSLITWSHDATARVWDTAQKRLVSQLTGHEDRVTAGGISPDGCWLLTGARNGELRLWELQYGQPTNSIPLQAEIRACLFLLDAETAIVVDANGRLTLHQIPSLQILEELATFQSVQAAALAPSGAHIALACSDGQIRFVALDGHDAGPLAVTGTQTVRNSANLIQRMFGLSRVQISYSCVCPVCRAAFSIAPVAKNQTSACPKCHRALRVCAVTESAEVGAKR